MLWLAPSFLLLSAALGAQDPSPAAVEVQWTAPPGCPDRTDVAARIAGLSEGHPAAPAESGTAALRVSARLEVAPTGYRATVTLSDGVETQRRELEADDCGVLARAVVLMVAVALDPLRVSSAVRAQTHAHPDATTPPETPVVPPPAAVRPTPDAEATAAVSPPADRSSPPTAAPSVPRSRRWPLEVGARVGLGVGGLVLPGAGVGVTAAPFVGIPPFVVRVVGQYWAPRRATLPERPGAGATFGLATGGLRLCPVLEPRAGGGRWRFPLCAGVDAGAIWARGEGSALVATRSATSAWAAVVLEPGVELGLAPWVGVFAAFEGAVSLMRPTFSLDNGGRLHEVGAFAPRGTFGVSFHRPRRPTRPR